MLFKQKHINTESRGNRLWQRVLIFQMHLAAWILLFAGVSFSTEARALELISNSSSIEESIQDEIVSAPSSVSIVNLNHDSNHHPFGPNTPEPTPEKELGSDEDEEDTLDEEWGNCHVAATLHEISVEKNQSFQLTRGIQNRTVRPLFMLYHSWKNFIS